MGAKKIIILATEGYSSTVIYNWLNKDFEIEKVIFEKPANKILLIRKRIKKLGYPKVFAQLLFQILVVPILKHFSKKRISEIEHQHALNNEAIPNSKIIYVESVNDDSTLILLQKINPSVVIVNGTRIISKKILNGCSATFINMHAGITPAYRGVHGGYWALVNNDPGNCGVTIHLVDQGIDTGAILYQKIIHPKKLDNFITYPVLQIVAGLPLLSNAIQDLLSDSLQRIEIRSESNLWYHPSIGFYLFNWMKKKIK